MCAFDKSNPYGQEKGGQATFLMCGFDKSNPYEIFEKVACPLFLCRLIFINEWDAIL